MGMLPSPTLKSHKNLAYVGWAWPKGIQGLGNIRSGAWVCGVTEGGLHALQRCAVYYAARSILRAVCAHYLGDIMRVAGYGQKCAGAISWGAVHLQMKGHDGAFCTHLNILSRCSYTPGLQRYSALAQVRIWVWLPGLLDF